MTPHLDVPGARLHYDEDGPADGPVVVFLHGAYASGRAFRGQLPALRDRYRVILPDQRGHGRSTRFEGEGPWPGVSLATLADDALRLIGHVSPHAPVHLVGISMGGIVAARVATLRPDRLRSLSLWSAPPRIDPKWIAYFREATPHTIPPQTQRLAKLWHGDDYWERLARGLFAHFSRPHPEDFEGRPRPPRALVMQADADDLLQPDDPEAWAARIDAPVTIVRAPGNHTFFADGRDGTKAANRALRAFLDGTL